MGSTEGLATVGSYRPWSEDSWEEGMVLGRMGEAGGPPRRGTSRKVAIDCNWRPFKIINWRRST